MKNKANRLISLPKVNNQVTSFELIELLKDSLNNVDEKIVTIKNLLINKIKSHELSVSEYIELRKELEKDDNKKLDRMLDAYIYVLNEKKDKIQDNTKYFILENNLDILKERIVLIKYKSYKETKYTTYYRNMNYLEIFKFIKDIDSKFMSFTRKITDNIDEDELELLAKDETFYLNCIQMFEEEFVLYKDNDITKILLEIYKEELVKLVKNRLNIRMRSKIDSKNEEYRKYVRDIKYERDLQKLKKKRNTGNLRDYSCLNT